MMIINGLMVSVGSTNFDSRSFRLDDEANLNIYYKDFAVRQISVFKQDSRKSQRITFEQWGGNVRYQKRWESRQHRY